MTNQLKDLVLGLYGRTPIPIDSGLAKTILKNYKRGEKPVKGRPADYLPPEIPEAKKRIGHLARTEEDVLAYILYPATMEKFLQSKYATKPVVSPEAEKFPQKKVAA